MAVSSRRAPTSFGPHRRWHPFLDNDTTPVATRWSTVRHGWDARGVRRTDVPRVSSAILTTRIPSMSLPSGAKLGPYEVLAPLGAGGMGEVYRAKDTRLDR